MPSDDDYLLGRTAEEFERLARQAALIEPETEDLFRRAGISAGMNVLEIGSGAGDVAMVVGRLVRPGGSVLGIEQSASSAASASKRVAAAGNLPVRFEVADLESYTPRGRYDALVGRFVLPYLADPPATLQHLASYVNPAGVVAFMEFDVTKIGSVPEGPLFRKISEWMSEAFRDGINPSLGSALGSVFHSAGLPWPQMRFRKSVVDRMASTGCWQRQLVQCCRISCGLVLLLRSRSASIPSKHDCKMRRSPGSSQYFHRVGSVRGRSCR